MARIMRRAGPSTHPDNTFVTMLTVPASKKYEIIGSWIGLTGAGGQLVALIGLFGAGSFILQGEISVPANETTLVWSALPTVLHTGESLQAGVFTNHADWSWWVTYMDVDE